MDYVFKNLGNGAKVDLVPYIAKIFADERDKKLIDRKEISIYVGSDSQNIGNTTVYAIVIVLHFGNNGGHVLYSKMRMNRIRDRFTRLWKEVEMSLEVAQFLEKEGLQKAKYIDIDLNPDPRFKSNDVLRAAIGLIESNGFTPRCKPNGVAASYVADRICH